MGAVPISAKVDAIAAGAVSDWGTPTAICNHCDLEVLRQSNDVFGKIPALETFSKADLRLRDKNLRHFILPSIFHDRLGDVGSRDYTRCDLQASRKAEMFLDRLTFIGS
jgi:hypothetical protein